jgi:hypothetical protein
MDILQCNNNAFVGRYIDTGDAGHGPSLLGCRRKANSRRVVPIEGGSKQ